MAWIAAAEIPIRTYSVHHGLGTLDAFQLSVAADLRRRGAVSTLVASGRNLCQAAVLEGQEILNQRRRRGRNSGR